MKLTSVRLQRSKREIGVLAYVHLEFDECFMVKSVRLIDLGNGPFIAMPDRQAFCRCEACNNKVLRDHKFCSNCGRSRIPLYATFKDIAHPITPEFRQYLTHSAIDAYYDPKTQDLSGVAQLEERQ